MSTQIEQGSTTAHNLYIRGLAHAELDRIIDNVDDIDDAFGAIHIEIPIQSGKLLRVEVNQKSIHK